MLFKKMNTALKRALPAALLGIVLLSACSPVSPTASPPTALPATSTAAPLPIVTPIPSSTFTAAASPTQAEPPTAIATAATATAATATAASTLTPTIPSTLAPSATPTRDYPNVVVNKQANCRYGPGMAYLYRWGLYSGDTAEVHGRNWNGTWYWIKPYNLDSHCWASEIVFDVAEGDPKAVPLIERRLPKTTFAGPPGNVQAARNGSQVTVRWDVVILSDDKRRGYLIEAMLCQNGAYFPYIIHTDDTTYTFTDEPGCATPSQALLYTAEKHGYSDPVQIPWP